MYYLSHSRSDTELAKLYHEFHFNFPALFEVETMHGTQKLFTKYFTVTDGNFVLKILYMCIGIL